MALPISGLTGPATLTDGSQLSPLRQGRQGEGIVQELHGRYYETVFRKAMFSGGNNSGVTTTVGTATTYTGLVLSNPIGSPVNLVVNKVGISNSVAPAAAMILGLMTGFSGTTNVVQTTPVVPQGNFVGQGNGVGLLAVSATLPVTPTLRMVLAFLTATAVTVVEEPDVFIDLEGSLILPPGAFVAVYTSVASGAAALAASFQWEEVPTNG
jgi:hypothetical protein